MTKLIIFLVVVGFVVFWWLKRRRTYREPLPPGDPKSVDFKPFWNRHRQNRRRFNIGCFSYFMFVCIAMLVYYFGQTYQVVNVKAQSAGLTATAVATMSAIPLPTVTEAIP